MSIKFCGGKNIWRRFLTRHADQQRGQVQPVGADTEANSEEAGHSPNHLAADLHQYYNVMATHPFTTYLTEINVKIFRWKVSTKSLNRLTDSLAHIQVSGTLLGT